MKVTFKRGSYVAKISAVVTINWRSMNQIEGCKRERGKRGRPREEEFEIGEDEVVITATAKYLLPFHSSFLLCVPI